MKVYPDISHYEPVKDWDRVKENCPFLISKATQGTTYVDTYLKEFVKQCEKRKIPYWLYVFLNKGDELAQAKFLVSTCKKITGDYFVGYILDVEKGNKSANVRDALAYLEGTGRKCMIYHMYADYSSYRTVILNRGKNTAWWEARYGKNDGKYRSKYPCHKGVDLHQYTENGACSGIPGKIDLNRITGQGKDEKWFCTPLQAGQGSEKTGYTGTFPALPPRGWYQEGDGYETLKDYPTQIKRVQMILNWAMSGNLKIDGKYGQDTTKLQSDFQKKNKLDVNGKFGDKSLAICKKMKK